MHSHRTHSLGLRRAPRFASKPVSRLAGVFAVALFATACGGGGGGGSRTAATAGTTAGAAASGSGSTSVNGGAVLISGAVSQAAFETTVYPLHRQFCETCHAGAGPGFPHIAHPDPGTAYRAVIDNQKVNLSTPASSRLVLRLDPEGHFCWSDCSSDAAQMEAAIADWAAQAIDPNAPVATGGAGTDSGAGPSGELLSATRTLADAVEAESGRDDSNAIALFTFEAGEGDTAFDSSNVSPPMNLTLEGTAWLSGGGIDVQGGRAVATPQDAMKLFNRIASGSGSQQYSIEAWVVPANVTQEGPARIVSYSQGTQRRNFTLGQTLYTYVFRNRSMALEIGENGTPALVTSDADEDLQATLQHVVVTFDQTAGRRVYVDGTFTDDVDASGPGLLVNWSPDYTFILGDETSNNRPWAGQIKLVAIYDRALRANQITANYLAGASEKFNLRLALDAWVEPGAYIEFEVSEFDAFSYLFCRPVLVSDNPTGVTVEGLRILVNGVAPVASQSFANVSTVVDEPRESLSSQCSVVPKDLGASADQFRVRFEVIGANANPIVELPPDPPLVADLAEPRPDVGVRDFAQVNDTMARLTTVDPTTAEVAQAFSDLEEQLPSSNDVRSFVSSQQVAISKLALEYCDRLVETPALRTSYFPGFDFSAPAITAFADPAERSRVIQPLLDRMLGVSLASQPDSTQVTAILNTLFDELTAGCDAAMCNAERTRTLVKAACSSTLASAAVQLQ